MENLSEKILFYFGKHCFAGRKAPFCGAGSDVLLREGTYPRRYAAGADGVSIRTGMGSSVSGRGLHEIKTALTPLHYKTYNCFFE